MLAHLIEVLVDDEYQDQVSPDALRAIGAAALAQQHVQAPCELAVVITSDSALQELNRRHRGIDAPTDVLAFANAPHGPFVEAPGQPRYLGDVIISYPQARAQATELGHGIVAELQLLVAHGILHLLGHDDAVREKRARMWAAQAEIVAAVAVDVTLPD
jgi:probable rRNA maturation factor